MIDGIGEADVGTRIHGLIGERHGAHAVRVGEFCGDGDGRVGHRLDGAVGYLADLRRDIRSGEGSGVGRAGGRVGRNTYGRSRKLGVDAEIRTAAEGDVRAMDRE